MCGIVGYVGPQDAPEIVLSGLKRLEYRGYDSAGVAVIENGGEIAVRREAGKLQRLMDAVARQPINGNIGIGHTRWATHGKPTQRNAHPHMSMNKRVVLVHNGIVENFLEIKDELEAEGVVFESDTDTEVIAQLLERHLEAGMAFIDATRKTLQRLAGSSAVVIVNPRQPDMLITARLGNAGGITLGLGEGEMYIASDIPAILDYTREMIFLENRQMAIITRMGYSVTDLEGNAVPSEIHTIPYDPISAARGEYRHFMQKEIFEQPRAIIDTLRSRLHFEEGRVEIESMNLSAELANALTQIYITACGTSYLSGLVGKFIIESTARMRTEVEYASEFRYYNPVIDDKTAVLAITQSGETADTLAAMELAKSSGATLWSIVNAIGSQAMRVADGHIAMHTGPEIGVASTKAFTSSIVDQYMLALMLGELRGTISAEKRAAMIRDLALLPDLAGRALETDAQCKEIAQQYQHASDFLFIGRGINYPIALEGALKLKEISYIHAEGYPAGEMKHGPIALIDEELPVVAIVTKNALYEKMVSQVEQVKARGGQVIALATEGDTFIATKADHVIYVPETPYLLEPVVNVIPLQLLAYHIAVWRGADVDQPRNLAKSVTVE